MSAPRSLNAWVSIQCCATGALFLHRLFRTGSASGNTDRGVLGHSIMEVRDWSQLGLNSSQGTPQKTIRDGSNSQTPKDGNPFEEKNQIGLEVRRKRHKTEGSSIHFFGHSFGHSIVQLFDGRGVVNWRRVFDWSGGPAARILATLLICAGILSPRVSLAGELGAQFQAQQPQDQIEAVGDNFESLMLQLMYNQMLRSNQIVKAGDNNPFAPSNAEMIYRSMQEESMLSQLAQRRPLGVGSLVARQLRGETGVGTRILVESDRGTQVSAGRSNDSEMKQNDER